MKRNRQKERKLYSCPETDPNDLAMFPALDEQEFYAIEAEASCYAAPVCLFPFLRAGSGGEPFIDLYVRDALEYPEHWERFIIREGMRLSPQAEDNFLFYTGHDEAYIPKEEFMRFQDAVIESFPSWHFFKYAVQYSGAAFEHIYFASHRSGVREILYKADLPLLANEIDKIPCVNYSGTTPAAIIGRGVTLKLLRILGHRPLIRNLYRSSSIEKCVDVYRTFSSYIGSKLPSHGQWIYLTELYDHDMTFGGYPFKRAVYEQAVCFFEREKKEAYRSYLASYKKVFGKRKLYIPAHDDIYEYLGRIKWDMSFEKYKDKLNEKVAKRKQHADLFEYEDDTYKIVMPSDAVDMRNEAVCQHNCLRDYVSSHGYGITTILFLRRKDEPGRSFVTVEVEDERINQVYARCNRLPSSEVYRFLIGYAKEKGFLFDVSNLIFGNTDRIDKDDPADKERLLALARQYSGCPVNSHLFGKAANLPFDIHENDVGIAAAGNRMTQHEIELYEARRGHSRIRQAVEPVEEIEGYHQITLSEICPGIFDRLAG